MEVGKNLVVSLENSPAKDGNKDDGEDSLTKEISLDYSDDDEEMLSDSAEDNPKRKERKDRVAENEDFAPVDDVDIFAVDDEHVDTSGGEIRRRKNVDEAFYAENVRGPPNIRRYKNPRVKELDESTSFINSDEQQRRRVERAKRFGLDPALMESSSEPSMIPDPTPDVLDRLYKFYDIDPNNLRHKEKYRLDAIYLRGVDRMSTENIFDYFGPYNPSYLEWVDDNSCNVVWTDQTAAARALLGMSSPLRRVYPPNANREEQEGGNALQSPLKRLSPVATKSSSPDPAVTEENQEPVTRILDGDDEPCDVDVTRVTVPPGCWRVGKSNSYSASILMRFSTVDDVKTRGAQRNSQFYRERGNPNFGGQTGLISRSYMDRIRGKRRRGNDDGDTGVSDLRKSISDRERWTLLRDDIRRSTSIEPGELVEEEDLTTGQVKLVYFSSDEDELDDPKSKRPRMRMRMRADEEEDRKQRNRRRLDRVKRSDHGGIEGDWRRSQKGGDLRDVLRESRMKITVANDPNSKRDLSHRLGTRKAGDWNRDDDRTEHDDR